MKLFVYGTLHEHPTMGKAGGVYVCPVETTNRHKFDTNWYPELRGEDVNGDIVSGHLYDVPTENMHILDAYEGAPYLYKLGKITTTHGKAHTYFANNI